MISREGNMTSRPDEIPRRLDDITHIWSRWGNIWSHFHLVRNSFIEFWYHWDGYLGLSHTPMVHWFEDSGLSSIIPNMFIPLAQRSCWGYICLTTSVRPSPHGLNCRPVPCIGVAGAMSASRVACTVVWFIVRQRQLHASPPANEPSWLLEPKFFTTPEIGSCQSRIDVYIKATWVQPGQCKTATPDLWIVFNDGYRVSVMYMIHSKVVFLLAI